MSDNSPGSTPAAEGSAPTPPPAPGYPPPPAYASPAGAAPSYPAPSGYAAPAYPQGTSSPQGYGYPSAPKTNTLAIVSLVSSLAALVILPFIGSLVGVITGHMSLSQIKRTGENGRGLALTGTIVGWVGLGFIVLGLLLFLLLLLPAIVVSGSTSYS
ncbi:DUF4190 domain-containing protein [Microbacterium aurantiacum]|uniref:DUF4190 domain-containing protein n=1 Tax=Microbacterium aurantiacum TaxID=162393 RepID=UPI0006AD487E|nr:DUF4190 domain-containing protein [Microbacterium chocolatum]